MSGWTISGIRLTVVAAAWLLVPALVALALEPKVKDFLVWSHRSAEPGARRLLEVLAIEPVLDLNLRLGEGTGAALAVPILRCACAMLREMATFSGAGVSKQS